MERRYDLLIVGGGFSGACCAIQAARGGLDVLLVEKHNCLGGAMANGLVMPFMSYWTTVPSDKSDITDISILVNLKEKRYLTGDLFLEIVSEMKKLGDMTSDHDFDDELLKLVLNRMCISSGVNLLFDTTVYDVKTENGKISSVLALGKSRKLELFADNFVDATGDGELSMLAGCEFKVGRESDGLCQPMTLCFRMGSVDKDKFAKNRAKINPLYKEFKEKGLIKNPRENVLIFGHHADGVLHFNTTRIIKLDPTNPFDITKAEIEAREQVFEIHKFLKENIEGFENCRVLSTALQIGIRESRKIVGEYTLTVDDLKSFRKFEDGIATANYDIDIHNPSGEGTSHYYFPAGKWYEIPYRSLISKGIKNMLVVGRCISSTHEAQASYRVMPYCAEIGQAAGVAVSVAKKNGSSLSGVDIAKVREILRENGFQL